MDKFINSIMNNLPVILLLIPLYLLVQKTLAKINKLAEISFRTNITQKQAKQIPDELKIKACERLILFLERITPSSLIPRTIENKQTNRNLQISLIEEIKKEYEYNATQQLYVNDQTWEACTNAKDQIISIINTASTKIDPQANSIELSNNILQIFILNAESIKKAKSLIKKELA